MQLQFEQLAWHEPDLVRPLPFSLWRRWKCGGNLPIQLSKHFARARGRKVHLGAPKEMAGKHVLLIAYSMREEGLEAEEIRLIEAQPLSLNLLTLTI